MDDIKEKRYRLLADQIKHRTSVLDLGCGSGEFLELLRNTKNVNGVGVEIDETGIRACISKGLSVYQGDIDEGLSDYRDNHFDYVCLGDTLQELKRPDSVIEEMVRVGRLALITVRNFAVWISRLELLIKGSVPKVDEDMAGWYSDANFHNLSIKDFWEFANDRGIVIHKAIYVNRDWKQSIPAKMWPNIAAYRAIFVCSK